MQGRYAHLARPSDLATRCPHTGGRRQCAQKGSRPTPGHLRYRPPTGLPQTRPAGALHRRYAYFARPSFCHVLVCPAHSPTLNTALCLGNNTV